MLKILTLRTFLFVLTTLSYSIGRSQSTLEKRIESIAPPYTEVYSVLAANQSIKHGNYVRKHKLLTAKGKYDQNEKVGTWVFTGFDGEVAQEFNFTTKKLTDFEKFDVSKKYWIKDDGGWKEIYPEQVPVFIGGKNWFYYYFNYSLKYLSVPKKHGIEGTVILTALITRDGRMIDEAIESGPGYGLNEEALRVSKTIPDDWIPAKLNGEAVDVRIQISVSFKLG
jgi:periplasmic protein TonB